LALLTALTLPLPLSLSLSTAGLSLTGLTALVLSLTAALTSARAGALTAGTAQPAIGVAHHLVPRGFFLSFDIFIRFSRL